jgi:hypothetical protein
MAARDQAEQLRQEAIRLLLEERQAIDQMLSTLGYAQEQKATSQKRRGRPPKVHLISQPEQAEQQQLSRSDTIREVCS